MKKGKVGNMLNMKKELKLVKAMRLASDEEFVLWQDENGGEGGRHQQLTISPTPSSSANEFVLCHRHIVTPPRSPHPQRLINMQPRLDPGPRY